MSDDAAEREVYEQARLAHEREAILKIATDWAQIDRSHRKLAHRGSRLEAFYASESTVLRVLTAVPRQSSCTKVGC